MTFLTLINSKNKNVSANYLQIIGFEMFSGHLPGSTLL